MGQYDRVIKEAYKNFNERKIDGLLAIMDPAVNWPNGWEGGFVKGHDAVKEYWTRQWKEIDPHVKPLKITGQEDGRVRVEVEQLVKDLKGNILFESRIIHLFTFVNGLIAEMRILSSEF